MSGYGENVGLELVGNQIGYIANAVDVNPHSNVNLPPLTKSDIEIA
jgi:hypothetical protein